MCIRDSLHLALPAGNPLATSRAPIALKLAAHEQFVSFARHQVADYFDRTAALCQEAGFTPDIRHEAGQFVNVLALVACGLGVAIVPSSFSTLPTGGVVYRPLQASRDKSRLAVLAQPGAQQDDWSQQIAQLAADALRSLEVRLTARPR